MALPVGIDTVATTEWIGALPTLVILIPRLLTTPAVNTLSSRDMVIGLIQRLTATPTVLSSDLVAPDASLYVSARGMEYGPSEAVGET